MQTTSASKPNRGQSYVVSLPEWSLSATGSPLNDDAETITLYDSAARQLASANLSSSPYGIAWAALNSEYIYIAIRRGRHVWLPTP